MKDEKGYLTLYMMIGPLTIIGSLSAMATVQIQEKGITLIILASCFVSLVVGSVVFAMFYNYSLKHESIKYIGTFYLATFLFTCAGTVLGYHGVNVLFI
jgi:hypothetical protein